MTGAAGIPAGARIRREDDGTLVLDLPVSRDRFLRWFLPLFSLPFTGAGLALAFGKGDAAGWIPLSIGLAVGWFGLYLAIGRLEIRLGETHLEWTRIYLKRWRTRSIPRESIASITTRAGVRTNGRPTSWILLLNPSGALPGFHSEPQIHWLGGLLATWSGRPYDGRLDRSIDNSD